MMIQRDRKAGPMSLATGLLLVVLALPASAQFNDPRFSDYFLVGRFGEICTMCEVTVLCEAGDTDIARAAVPETGNFTLYYIQTRTFWSQIGTIWEWFISNFDGMAVDGHERPVWIYEISDGNWSGPDIVQARVSLEPPLVAMPGEAIERQFRHWQRPVGDNVGYCHRLPLWDTLHAVEQHAPGAET
jgi:hypothetical protein